jgi:predicted transcriptional regulator of viral defense system
MTPTVNDVIVFNSEMSMDVRGNQVAAHLTEPCYISLWSAMSIRSLTTQIPFAVEVVTSRRRFKRKIAFLGTKIFFYTVKPALMFGYENIVWNEGLRIAVAKPEKIIIDALYFRAIPVEDLEEMMDIIDKALLQRYAKLTKNKKIMTAVRRLIRCCPHPN